MSLFPAILLLTVLQCALGLPGAATARAAGPLASGTRGEAALDAAALGQALGKFDRSPGPMQHPRLFGGASDRDGILTAARGERAKGVSALADYLRRHSVTTLSPWLRAQIREQDTSVRSVSKWQQDRLLEGITESAFVWYLTRDDWFLQEMRDRMQLMGQAVLARACSGDVAETRDYVWYFALAYDFTAEQTSRADRQLIRDVVKGCAKAGLARLPATLRAHPDNPIAFNALGKFVGAMLILRGDMPDAAQWLDSALPAYVTALSPWGGRDGGFANGSSYALWDAGESLLVWDLIEQVLQVPLYRTAWLANLSRFLTYTLPPDTPAGAFGDGAEVNRHEERARIGQAIALRARGPLAAWYARQLKGGDPARILALLSPRMAKQTARLPAATPDSAAFPSVGVVAMHSALADPQRISVLFKSSPFGSLNHSHADQNSFVLYGKGEVLAMDSGAYDAYDSPHWRNWYKQTRAHNAITFDGGMGQVLGPAGLGERGANGSIVRFSDHRAWVLAEGEARDAYGKALDTARRTLVYVRPSTLFIIDRLESTQPHQWEWNLHTGAPLAGKPDAFTVQAGQVRLCGIVAANDALDLRSSSGYTPPPSIPAAPHYWNRFAFQTPSASALFVAVLRVDCTGRPPEIRIGLDTAEVSGAGMIISAGPGGVTARASSR